MSVPGSRPEGLSCAGVTDLVAVDEARENALDRDLAAVADAFGLVRSPRGRGIWRTA